MRPYGILDDTQEVVLLETILTTPHPVFIPGNQSTVQRHKVHQQENEQLPGHVPECTEGQQSM